jgi:CheY-like chemotaxis protein
MLLSTDFLFAAGCTVSRREACEQDITASASERVFEPFFTTKEADKGTGLGRSQVYGFVRQSGGDVRIYSEPGRGTTAKMYLPRHVGPAIESEQRPDDVRSVRGKGETILLVEDNSLMREHAREALEDLGYTVLDAEDAQSAMRIVEARSDVALLFTDLALRGSISGMQLAERVVADRPAVKVLFTTGYSRNAIVRQEQIPAGSALISKPYTITSLAREMRRIFDS